MGKPEIRPRITPEEYEIVKQHRGLLKECEKEGIPIQEVNHYWYKGKHYSIHVRNQENDTDFFDRFKDVLEKQISRTYRPKKSKPAKKVEGVLKWSDLHFGAHIRNLILSQDYDEDVLLNGLLKSVEQVNSLGFKKVHVHINGDLIESFSGLNHVNSWMSMKKDLIGAKAIKLCAELLEKALSEIENLGEVKIIAGNHDRVSKANDEDVKGGAAELISWALELKGFSVEFHPMLITHLVDGINHINLHGHFGISKSSTEKIIWNYGTKGKYNFVFEGHLHSLIEKASIKHRDNINLIKDDSIDYRRMNLPSFFTGNYYSETLGFTTNPGYLIVWDNGNGTPNIFNGTV